MDRVEQFYETVRREMTVTLATAAADSVTMRVVSPVLTPDGILFFTCEHSTKYRQLFENPHCCLAAGPFFAECTAAFLGRTMAEKNAALRDAYSEKFPGAFDEGITFGGRNASFIMLRPVRLTGWGFDDSAPNADGIPTTPFDIPLS